ncbi:MAG: VWA-like domain-containing protein [Candidatus Methanomethyliaceae archaeon]
MSSQHIIEEIRGDLKNIRIFCGRHLPFIMIPLSYATIVATESVPTAGVDERGVLAINPKWWTPLPIQIKRFVAIHECMHAALQHPSRSKAFDRLAYNLAADGKIFDAIEEAGVPNIKPIDGGVSMLDLEIMTGLRYEVLKRMSTEEIAVALKRAGKLDSVPEGYVPDIFHGDIDGDPIQSGGAKDPNFWKDLCRRAIVFAKMAGNVSGGLERLVSEVVEKSPPWNMRLRLALGEGLRVDSTFSKASRRGDEYPGQIDRRTNIWCLVDTSGSITEDELRKFLGIIKHESRHANIYVVPWDADAYEVIKVTNPSDVVKRIAKIKGGGGTVCLPALKKVYKLMSAGDAVVILTDGDIFDIGDDETKDLMRTISCKASFAMIGYTYKPAYAPGFMSVCIGGT